MGQFGVVALERLGDVLQKHGAKNNVLVFGRLKVAAQAVSSFEEFGLEAEVGGADVRHVQAFDYRRLYETESVRPLREGTAIPATS